MGHAEEEAIYKIPHKMTGLADLNHLSQFKSTDFFFIKLSDLNQYFFLFFFKLWTNQSCFG